MSANERGALTIDAFEAGSIDAEAFDHESHVYVAWLYLDAYATAAAIDRFTAALKRLTVHLGVAEKYHQTISWFYMLVIAERRNPNESWADFRRANPELFGKSDDILARYYDSETLASDRARTTFVLPRPMAA